MRYLDGELSPSERERVERGLADSTEARRTLAVFRAMKGDLQELRLAPESGPGTLWDRVSRKVARPTGWILTLLGAAIWVVYGAYLYLSSSVNPLEKMATGAVVLGILLLLATVIWERYREWDADPYRHVQR